MGVREKLIAARDLIDTPEKWEAMGRSTSRAIYSVTGGWNLYFEAEQAVAAQRVRGNGHRAKLAQFDRAIAACEAQS